MKVDEGNAGGFFQRNRLNMSLNVQCRGKFKSTKYSGRIMNSIIIIGGLLVKKY